MKKTNAMRILDANKIAYEVIEYDENQEVDGLAIALGLGLSPEIVFKTLLWQGSDKKYFVFVIPVTAEMNPKKTAGRIGEKNLHMTSQKDLVSLTGYVRGGVSPIGMKKEFPIYLDRTAFDYETIIVSGGKKGLQVKLDPQDLLRITGGEILEIVKESVYEDSESAL